MSYLVILHILSLHIINPRTGESYTLTLQFKELPLTGPAAQHISREWQLQWRKLPRSYERSYELTALPELLHQKSAARGQSPHSTTKIIRT